MEGLVCFRRYNIGGSVLFETNVTSQVSAHCKILKRSALRRSAEEIGSLTIINRLVSRLQINVHKSLFQLRCFYEY